MQIYIRWLQKKTGKWFRLPSEAEWEYAARAGKPHNYKFSDDINCSLARYGHHKHSDFVCGNDSRKTSVVQSYPANAYGSFDMHGNVDEWLADCWNPSYYHAPNTAQAWLEGNCDKHPVRGGSWSNKAKDLSITSRSKLDGSMRGSAFGFRLVLDQ